MSIERKEMNQFGRTLVAVENIGFSTGERTLFYGANFLVRQGECVAVTGKSGVGKSVMLRILVGQEVPDQGIVRFFRSPKISYVPQDLEDLQLDHGDTARDMFYQPSGLNDLEAQKEQLEARMAAGSYDQKILEDYGNALEGYEKLGGYTAEARAIEIMDGLGITKDKARNINLETRLGELSSGQRKKLLIGQALFGLPDLLILDDPTTHLDIDSIKWLSEYLRKTNQGSVIATNDVDLLDRFTNKVIEITDIGRVIAFEGNYKDFQKKRDELVGAEIKSAELMSEEIERLTETVARYRRWGNRSEDVARRRVVTERRVERMKDEYEKMPGAQIKPERPVKPQVFEFLRRSGSDVIQVKDVRKSYGNFEALDLSGRSFIITFGERFSIFGRNGSGKSTLVKLILGSKSGDFKPEEGVVELGSSVDLGVYTPELELSASSSIVDEIKRSVSPERLGRMRAVLEYWGFDWRQAEQRTISSLSQGERTQLLLSKLMLQMPNLLLLDEPTSNLADHMKKRLVDALKDYKGTLVVVSHNPDFVEQLGVDRELRLPEGEIVLKK